ncbi:PDR/VanB family oxidoreductase [Limnohabitans sp. INBF002]|uniref:PDR/VanB family oxidoreductase n=1 Tax=Limnohabitans sp. INBF002 TaxID=2986280 RepID=UPI0023775C24|nr:PDR/VanB family oxidoreductase [Limnohabitans sp. INBF002]BDU52115.1 iron-sulfur protein [Limnohabitans sp. INBF002]
MSEPFTFLRVTRKQSIATDITLFELAHPEGQELPAFTAGAHITVQTPIGMRRSYSLCGDPEQTTTWQIAVKRDAKGRGGSQSMVDNVQAGDLLPTLPWANLFELNETAASYIFVAGGIGITPILSMMRRLLSQGRTDFKLYYCTRDAAGTAFMDELHAPELAGKVKVHHDHGDPAKALDLWPVFERPSNAHVYCCGPQGLMDSVRDMTGHWPSERIHFESFGVAQTGFAENKIFDVVLQKSGTRMTVPTEQSILEVLRACGHVVSSSCESGTCGSCRTGLIAGEAEHRDMVLRPDEHTHQIMVCVSRAKSTELVLDL